jgi:thiol:disulfide interchange protein
LPLILILRNTMERNLSAPLERLRVGILMLAYPVTLIALVVSGWGPLRVSLWGMLVVIFLLWRALPISEPVPEPGT